MKMTKTILAIIIIMAVLLLTLCGCGEMGNGEIIVEQPNEFEAEKSEPTVSKEEHEAPEEEVSYMPLEIRMRRHTKFKDKMLKQIEISKTIEKGDQGYGQYFINKISDIKEFYSLDDLKIYGYRPYAVGVTEGSIRYNFVPMEEQDNEYAVWLDSVIWMSITRPEWVDKSDPLKDLIQQSNEQGWGYLTEDYMLYSSGKGDIFATIGDTLLYIRVPEELDSYEYLRDLAFNVIETAELVVVGE